MTQTERTVAAVQALLADNASEDISPEDLRDAIATVIGGYASLLLTINNAPQTKVGVAQTPVVITEYDLVGSQSIDANAGGHQANATTGELTVGETGLYFVSFFASFSLSQNNKVVHFHPFIDGQVGLVEVERFVGTGSDIGVVAMNAVVPYAAGAVVDMRVFIDAGVADVTFQALGFSTFRVG